MKSNNSIFVIWKSPESRRNYLVGRITRDEKYSFNYESELEEAKKEGFTEFIPFPNKDELYKNEILFPIFSNRLPDKKRKDIQKILKKYNLESYDEFELLKMGAELPTDNLKFVTAIDSTSDLLNCEMYLSGVRHYLGCKGKNCNNAQPLVGDDLHLEAEPENKKDEFAIKVMKNENIVGYIPRYYNKLVNQLFEKESKMKCKLINYNKDKNCDKCIKMRLDLNGENK